MSVLKSDILIEIFMIFFNFSMKITEQHLRAGHSRFISYPFQLCTNPTTRQFILGGRTSSVNSIPVTQLKGTTKKITRWKSFSPRPEGRPEKQWEEDILQDLQIMKIKS
jgi:hypothetical protein